MKKWSYTVKSKLGYDPFYRESGYGINYKSDEFTDFESCYRSFIKYVDSIDEDDDLYCNIIYTNYSGIKYTNRILRDGQRSSA